MKDAIEYERLLPIGITMEVLTAIKLGRPISPKIQEYFKEIAYEDRMVRFNPTPD
jgi:hypothetical protein